MARPGALQRITVVVLIAGAVCLGAVRAVASSTGSAAAAIAVRPAHVPTNAPPARPEVCVTTRAAPSPRAVPARATERVVIGASVIQLTARQLHRQIPGVVIDARGGRSWEIRSTGDGPTLWEAYLSHRATMRAGDWLVMEAARGDIPVGVNRACLERVEATVPKGACLAWVLPHEYYGAQTPAMRTWNSQTEAMIRAQLAGYPCHALIEWDALVVRYQSRATGLTPAQQAVGEPLLYDGRHPTALGASVLAAAIRRATAAR